LKTKRFISLILALIVISTCLISCENPFEPEPTDEEMIEERINTFLTAYNSGDLNTVFECLDSKSRNTYKALFNVLGGILGSLSGLSLDLSDLFTLGVNTSSGDFMDLEITDITITENEKATATARTNLAGSGIQIIKIELVYENDGWYIHDMKGTQE